MIADRPPYQSFRRDDCVRTRREPFRPYGADVVREINAFRVQRPVGPTSKRRGFFRLSDDFRRDDAIAVLDRGRRANIRLMFQAMVTRLRSLRTLSRPRNRNWRKPSADLMTPNTGSGVCLRKAWTFLPAGVFSLCAIVSAGVGSAGAGGGGAKRSASGG